jgi:hypothetical protein
LTERPKARLHSYENTPDSAYFLPVDDNNNPDGGACNAYTINLDDQNANIPEYKSAGMGIVMAVVRL